MLYAILCYHDEKEVGAWPKAKDDAILAKRAKVRGRLAAEGRMGPVARLMPTTAATTVRLTGAGREPVVIDGPFAETKEQLLGLYLIECASLDDAINVARDLGRDETATFEIRPVRLFHPAGAGA